MAITGLVATGTPLHAATSSTVVGAEVLSATSISAAGCLESSAATTFGPALPGISAITTADCTVVFGSSNDSSMLKAYQSDRFGSAMYSVPTGALDPAWGTSGYLARNDGGAQGLDTEATAATGDKVFYSGWTTGIGWRVAKFDAAGGMDAGWNGGAPLTVDAGVTYPVKPGEEDIVVAEAPDGKVVVVGVVSVGGGVSTNLFVRRYLATGAPDPAFNGNAFRVLDNAVGGWDVLPHVQVRPDRRIVISASNNRIYSTVWQLQEDGTPDTTWAGDGAAEITWAGPGNLEVADVALDSNGRALLAGVVYLAAPAETRMVIARVRNDGTLDPAFGASGLAIVDAPVAATANSAARAVALQDDGSVIAAGSAQMATRDKAVVKLDDSGNPVNAFSGDGIQTIDVAGGTVDIAEEILPQPLGSILVAGEAGAAANASASRLLATGAADPTFGTNGTLLTTSALAAANGMVQMPDGEVLLTGTNAAATQQSLVRIAATPIADFSAGANNWSTAHFGACLQTATSGASGGAGVSGWTVAGVNNCTTALPANWNPVVATAATGGAKVAAALAPTATAQVTLRFGFRSTASQAAGTYVAPLVFETIAPNA